MRVFNLTRSTITYRGKPVPPNGGSSEFPDLDVVPPRDMELQDKKVLSFGSLPSWWVARKKSEEKKVVAVPKVVEPATKKLPDGFRELGSRRRK